MPTVFTLNGGSSSIRFALYDATDSNTKLVDGQIERIGSSGASKGMTHSGPERVTARLIADLLRYVAYDPEHLPRELELIDAVT